MKTITFARSIAVSAVSLLIITGCGGGGGSGDNSSPLATPAPGNAAPTISGTPPPSVLAGNRYSFTPQSGDADGDALSYSISGMPQWAAFDTATGELTGEPTVSNVGIYDNIVISVSDGEATASLAPFSVSVDETATGSVTLSWSAPTENTDGTVLSDLKGFKIYVGTQSGDYNEEITIENASVDRLVVENLTPGTYYFVATALTRDGKESEFSNEIRRNVS